jgi:site-specific recombinase XerD
MQNNFEYDEISTKAYGFLKERLFYQYVTIRHYRSRWHPVKEYMDKCNIKLINSTVCKDFIIELYNGRCPSELTDHEKLIVKAVSVLCEFIETGAVQKRCKVRHLYGPIGKSMRDFLDWKRFRRLKPITIAKIESHLSSFNFWLSAHEIFKVDAISYPHIIGFIKSLDPLKKALIHDSLMDLRGFFTYLYENKKITENLAVFVPKDNYQRQAKLPSYYTEQEIQQLLTSVDRGTIVGKRDYAILVLAAYLGLRASDIALLQFRNLQWQQSKISISQFKTGKEITLPLLPIVGNALLDYIQYGRPKSNEPFIFLFVISPFLPILGSTIAGMINRRFIYAGLKSKERRNGGHALRHSLVKELLNNNESLPVISEVLGHKNTTSTRHYIRIDTESLRQCALDVPLVYSEFYNQKNAILFS